ncbi:MAG: transcription-repair coupling factor [Candidatus Omnitrophota bacterium]
MKLKSEVSPFLLDSLLHEIVSRGEFVQAFDIVRRGGQVYCGQAVGSSKALLTIQLAAAAQAPVVAITPDQSGAYLMLDDVEFFQRGREAKIPVFVYPHLEILPYESQAPELAIGMERLAPIQYYLEHYSNAPDAASPMIVIAPVSAVLKRLPPLTQYERQALRLQSGKEISRDAIAAWLAAQGYEFRDLVAQRGDFSIRGDIVDIYSFSYPDPVRIELWGDEIDSIRLFDISTQRSKTTVKEAVFYASNEDSLIREALADGIRLPSLPSLLGPRCAVVLAGEDEVEKEGEKFVSLIDKRYREITTRSDDEHELLLGEEDFHKHQQAILEPPETLYFNYGEWENEFGARPLLSLTEFALDPGPQRINLGFATPEIFGEDKKERIASLIRLTTAGSRVLIVCDNSGQQSRLEEIFETHRKENNLPPGAAFPQTVVGELHRGFASAVPNILLCADREIFGRYHRFKTPAREGIAMPIADLMDLKPGEFVVHIDHGIGRFTAIRRMTNDGVEGEFLELEYADNGVLYVPIDQVDKVGHYVGGENAQPALSKLGTKNWERAKARARQAIEDMAEELLELYATRRIRKGHSFAQDTPWQHEFEASFLYEETADQWRAIEEVKRDMENGEPMDRLICGDVGFGKTEVAIRAAFKAVMDGKQVAILTPTTILCQQHYNTFKDRLAEYPVRVEMLSRFLSSGEQKIVVEDVKNNEVDICIGTHRLLSKDIQFSDLGLVIIDEEQRFGVKHKERLRQIRKLVDTLTLTATPIPRTLYMSISGIRNMSMVSTPPKNRLPIETYIMEWSPDVIENAILRELSRDGQVYFVHNRVESILQVANYVQEIVPQARICVGHGQMAERELETIMMRFIRRDYDILVATSIIENGLDIPNVNTIIINKADHFGLSQLYQLRGRVGRDRHRAYCYLLVPSKKALTPIARRRLLALQEHNQLGSGFHLAMRDMELRGIGNILGRQQHGHIAAIGFDLYTKLLADTVHSLKRNKNIPLEWETTLEIVPKGSIPPNYVESSKQRMSLHQRIAKIKTFEEIESLKEELSDIYGKIPAEVERLLYGVNIRVRAHQAGMDIVSLRRNKGYLRYHLSQAERFNPMRILEMDGWEGLKLLVTTKGDNVAIEFQDPQNRGFLADKAIPLIDALEAKEAPVFQKPTPPPPPPPPKKKILSKAPGRKRFY